MKKLLILVGSLIATAGCDDPAVADRAVSVLEHGVVRAEVACALNLTEVDYLCPGGISRLKIDLLQDGSSFGKITGNGSAWGSYMGNDHSSFNSRHDPPQVCFASPENLVCFTAINGDIVIAGDGVFCGSEPADEAFSIQTYCTGFNLSAFGVTE